jgi:hypothetical membrane protein
VHAVNEFPAAVTRPVVLGAACWTLTIAFFVDQAIVQAASTRPYSLATNFISDLGSTVCGPSVAGSHVAVCSPLHGVMNGTFVVVGLLHTIGAIATRRAWPPRRLATAGLVLLAIAGTGLTLAGLSPENVDLGLHSLGAVYGIVGLNVAMVLLGAVLLRAARGLGVLALAAGVVGLVGFVLFTNAPLPVGFTERIAVFPGRRRGDRARRVPAHFRAGSRANLRRSPLSP